MIVYKLWGETKENMRVKLKLLCHVCTCTCMLLSLPPLCIVFSLLSICYLLGEGHYWQTRVLLSLKSCEYSDVCSGASRHQPDILLKLLNLKKGEKIVKLVISCTLLSKIWVFYYAIVKSTTKVTLWHSRDQQKFNVSNSQLNQPFPDQLLIIMYCIHCSWQL